MTDPTFHDAEQLSAYLDGSLSQADAARLQARIAVSPELEALFRDLSQSRALLRSLPQRRSPRNFTLSPQKAGLRPPLPRAYPALRFASGLAMAVFFFAFLMNFISLPTASQAIQAAEAPADSARSGLAPAPAATAAPTQGSLAAGNAVAPTPTPEMGFALAPPQASPVPPGLGGGLAATQAPTGQAPSAKSAAPRASFPAWQEALLALALVLAGLAFFIRWRADRQFAKKMGKR